MPSKRYTHHETTCLMAKAEIAYPNHRAIRKAVVRGDKVFLYGSSGVIATFRAIVTRSRVAVERIE